jgi:flavin reductase (DIM6/NTAB) family NADH-FMN oxidoreductase RutF
MVTNRQLFKEVMSRFATGVTVVTTYAGDSIHGMTATAFSGVSLDPPLVLVCIDHNQTTHHLVECSGVFAVNLLRFEQKELAERFAGMVRDVTDRFAGVEIRTAVTGSPILTDSLAWMDCRVWAAYAGGDHTIFVGEIVAGAVFDASEPLLYYQRNWSALQVRARIGTDAKQRSESISA